MPEAGPSRRLPQNTDALRVLGEEHSLWLPAGFTRHGTQLHRPAVAYEAHRVEGGADLRPRPLVLRHRRGRCVELREVVDLHLRLSGVEAEGEGGVEDDEAEEAPLRGGPGAGEEAAVAFLRPTDERRGDGMVAEVAAGVVGGDALAVGVVEVGDQLVGDGELLGTAESRGLHGGGDERSRLRGEAGGRDALVPAADRWGSRGFGATVRGFFRSGCFAHAAPPFPVTPSAAIAAVTVSHCFCCFASSRLPFAVRR